MSETNNGKSKTASNPPSILVMGLNNYKAFRIKKSLDPENFEDIERKIIVITGANSGIGIPTTLEMVRYGATVVMCCRDIAKAENVVKDIKKKVPIAKLILVPLDLGDLASVRSCAQEIQAKVPHVNILINNAGVMLWDSTLTYTKDGFESNMGINHLGHFLFTHLLLGHLKKGSPGRIIFVSSTGFQQAQPNFTDDLLLEKTGAFGEQNLGPYANSKLANMYTAYSFSKKLEEFGIRTYVLCPGFVKTDLGRNIKGWKRFAAKVSTLSAVSPEVGAETTIYCALSKETAAQSGLMYHHNRVWEGVMEKTINPVTADKLWEMSGTLVGLDQNNAQM